MNEITAEAVATAAKIVRSGLSDSGRHWPFAVGDRVQCRGNWGPLCCDLRIHWGRHPDAVYVVHAVAAGGRWLSVRDEETGQVYEHGETLGPSIGGSYFRVAGDCGEHYPGWSTDEGAWICSRCDRPAAEWLPRELLEMCDA